MPKRPLALLQLRRKGYPPDAIYLRVRSAAQEAQRLVDEDPVLAEALSRGIVNLRAAARWLIKTNGLRSSETAMLSGLRRYAAQAKDTHFAVARTVVGSSKVHTRAGVCVVRVPRTHASQERIATLFRSLDYARGENLRIVDADPTLMLVSDLENLPKIERAFGPGILEVERGITEVTVVMPLEGSRTPGVLSLLSTALAVEGVNIIHSAVAGRKNTFFVSDEEALRAIKALNRFGAAMEKGSARPRPG